jgi:AraC-like DNA-binding protein
MRWLEMVLGLQGYSVLEGKCPYEFLPELSSSCQNEEKLHSLSSTMINHGVSRGVEMKTEPKTMAVGARLAVKKLKRAGADVDAILGRVGLTSRIINRKDGWIPEDSLAELFEIAAVELDDPYFGLHLGEEEDIHDYGALAYIGIASKTLGDAIQNLQRYLYAVTEGWEIDLSVERRDAVIDYFPRLAKHQNSRHMAEGNACSLMIAYQTFLGQPLQPKQIQFAHPFDGGTKEHEIVLGCPVKFQQNRNRIILDRNDLALPIKTADDRLLRILKDYCKQTYQERTQDTSDLVSEIHEAALDLIPKGRAHAREIADELGTSERTLHRRLTEEGKALSSLLDDFKRDLALKYVKQRGLKMEQVAFLLGYANHSSFTTAFKRWTGKTPREARQS